MNIAVIFGGESCEHDISVITGIQLINNLNEYLYNIIPIYINKKGVWYTGKNLRSIDKFSSSLDKLKEVSFVPGEKSLYIKKNGKYRKFINVDMAFVCLHGQRGEDGSVSGVLELSHIPYSSSSLMASSIAMDKIVFKYFLKSLDINNVPGVEIVRSDYDFELENVIHKMSTLGFPVIIKPARQGSSIGIKIC